MLSLSRSVLPCALLVAAATIVGAPTGPTSADDPPTTGSLTIRASVSYTPGWSPATPAVFSFSSALGNVELGHNDTVTFPDLVPGDYSVTQQIDPDFFFFAVSCSGNLDFDTSVDFNTGALTVGVDPGENITCTFSNNRRAGQVRVATESIGGTSAEPWTYRVEQQGGDTGPNPFASLADNEQTSLVSVPTGTYTVTQNELPDGWITTIDCGDGPVDGGSATIEVANGSSTTCTATNTRRGSVTIRSSVSYNTPWNVDADRTFDFSGDLGTFSLANLETYTVSDLDPDDYTIVQALDPHWFFFAVSCSGNLDFDTSVDFTTGALTLGVDPGENITCTFSNDRHRGNLRIVETTIGDTPPTANWTYELQPTVGNELAAPFATVPDGGQTALISVPTGGYTLTQNESNVAWLTSIDCGGGATIGQSSALTIERNATTTCTVTNTALGPNQAPALTGPSGPIEIVEGAPFTFVGPHAVTLTDPDAHAGILSLTVTPSGGTSNVSGTLDGTLAELQTALAGLTFTPHGPGPASITIDVDDNGWSGSGGPLTDELVVSFDVLPLPNGPPTLVLPSTFSVLPGEVISFTDNRRIVVERPSSSGDGPLRLIVTASGGTVWYAENPPDPPVATTAVRSAPAFVGSLEEVQARLDALRFTITAGPGEWAELTLRLDDASTDGDGAAWVITETLRLRVAGALDVGSPAPSTTVPATPEPTDPPRPDPPPPTSPPAPTAPSVPVDPAPGTPTSTTPPASPDGRLPSTGAPLLPTTMLAGAMIVIGLVLLSPARRRMPRTPASFD